MPQTTRRGVVPLNPQPRWSEGYLTVLREAGAQKKTIRHRPGTPRPLRRQDHHDLYPCLEQRPPGRGKPCRYAVTYYSRLAPFVPPVFLFDAELLNQFSLKLKRLVGLFVILGR